MRRHACIHIEKRISAYFPYSRSRFDENPLNWWRRFQDATSPSNVKNNSGIVAHKGSSRIRPKRLRKNAAMAAAAQTHKTIRFFTLFASFSVLLCSIYVRCPCSHDKQRRGREL
jgi:hypothetical protein